jgi:cytochrome c-type biogenesis protein CcmH/NrfF
MSRGTYQRTAQAVLAALLVLAGVGASDASARFDKDSHALMCTCGCNELLGECNHVSCPDSGPMLKQLAASIARGDSDDAIFHDFQSQYGPAVLAAPMFTRFNHFAWILPPLVLLLGIAGTLLLLRKWKLRPARVPSARKSPVNEAIRKRIRSETEL